MRPRFVCYQGEKTAHEGISLIHYADFTYCTYDVHLEVYFGRLSAPFEVYGDENELLWMDIHEDFFDMTRFAGEGNIGHIVAELRLEGLIGK